MQARVPAQAPMAWPSVPTVSTLQAVERAAALAEALQVQVPGAKACSPSTGTQTCAVPPSRTSRAWQAKPVGQEASVSQAVPQ